MPSDALKRKMASAGQGIAAFSVATAIGAVLVGLYPWISVFVLIISTLVFLGVYRFYGVTRPAVVGGGAGVVLLFLFGLLILLVVL